MVKDQLQEIFWSDISSGYGEQRIVQLLLVLVHELVQEMSINSVLKSIRHTVPGCAWFTAPDEYVIFEEEMLNVDKGVVVERSDMGRHGALRRLPQPLDCWLVIAALRVSTSICVFC